jgi:hypothetical protein
MQDLGYRSRRVLAGEDGAGILRGHPVQVQVDLWRPPERGRRLGQCWSGPRHSVERGHGSLAAAGKLAVCPCLFDAPRSAGTDASRPGRTRRPAFGASPHVQAIPAEVGAGSAAVGHHLARRQADTTHPAGRDRGQTSRSGNQILLISHNQLPPGSPLQAAIPEGPEAGREQLRRRGWLNRPGSVARSRPAVHALPPTDSMLARGSAAETGIGRPLDSCSVSGHGPQVQAQKAEVTDQPSCAVQQWGCSTLGH